MKVEASLGDVVDRITILDLKLRHIEAEPAISNVQRERQALIDAWVAEAHPPLASLEEWAALSEVNQALWTVEDQLRLYEQRQEFDADFIDKARSVYRLNDRRAALKRSINIRLGSRIVEEKSYA